MWSKIIVLLTLLFYVNCIAYHESAIYNAQTQSLENGETVIEFILEDILDLPAGDEPEGSEFQYDDYRSATSIYSIITVAIIFLFFRKIYPEKSIGSQYVRANKISPIQIGYYRYLFRLKPF